MKISNISSSIFTISLLFFVFFGCGVCCAQSNVFSQTPKREVRAVWLTTLGGLDWPHNYAQSPASIQKQKNELIQILDRLKAANINTVLFQTRVRGNVIYPSSIEEWASCISGIASRSPGYDPLLFAIDECHKRGMELQAWVVAIPVGKWNSAGCKALRKKRPAMMMKIGDEGFINPAHPMSATYIASICREITEQYDVDGIHLDYIRYPETWRRNIPAAQARDNITRIVREVHRSIKEIKPWVKLSCSPVGKYDDLSRYTSRGWNAKTKVCQDAQLWLRLGIMDQIYPMMYFRGDNFYPFAIDWQENSCGRTVVPGLGIYFMSPREANWPLKDITDEMLFLRNEGMGYAFFRSKFFTDDTKGLYSFIHDQHNLYPALTPPMTWEDGNAPTPPTELSVKRTENGLTIVTWRKSTSSKQGGILYNVYASKSRNVDANDSRNLIAVRLYDNQLTLTDADDLHFAVTSIDRFGNESTVLQQHNDKSQQKEKSFISNDGKRMKLPKKGKTLDADYILFESMTGIVVATRPYKGEYADIRDIKDGVYRVLSVNKKNVTHRLGFVIIRRK